MYKEEQGEAQKPRKELISGRDDKLLQELSQQQVYDNAVLKLPYKISSRPLYVDFEGENDVMSLLQKPRYRASWVDSSRGATDVSSMIELLKSDSKTTDDVEKTNKMGRLNTSERMRKLGNTKYDIIPNIMGRENEYSSLSPVRESEQESLQEEERPATAHISSDEKNEVSGLMDGINVAREQVGLTWKNILKNVERIVTTDEEKRARVDEALRQIEKEYEELPQTRGLATMSSVATNVVGVGLPVMIAGMLAGPELATGVGIGAMGLDIMSTISQADLEMDAYERQSGKKIPTSQRTSYVVALTATDLIMNTLLGGNMLKGFTKSSRRELAQQIAQGIYDNPVAQQEFNTMTRRVLQREQRERLKGVARAGVEGGVTSGMMEAEKSIYTGEAPELENIVSSALGGTLTASVQSGVSSGIQKKMLHNDRMKNDRTYYVSDVENKPTGATPISEIVITDVHPAADGKRTLVEGEIIDAGSDKRELREYDLDNVVSGSYAKAMEDPWVHKNYDDIEIPAERAKEYHRQWESTKKMKERDKAYELQNELVQRMAADMGLPIVVYKKLSDLPDLYRDDVKKNSYGGFTTLDGATAIVLEKCQNLTAHNVETIIRHEVLGHKGMPRTYENEEQYRSDLYEAGLDLLPQHFHSRAAKSPLFVNSIEERGALKTETRPYSPHGTPNTEQQPYENYRRLYEMLRRSEDAARNSTFNELRKKNYDIGGNPMPRVNIDE